MDVFKVAAWLNFSTVFQNREIYWEFTPFVSLSPNIVTFGALTKESGNQSQKSAQMPNPSWMPEIHSLSIQSALEKNRNIGEAAFAAQTRDQWWLITLSPSAKEGKGSQAGAKTDRSKQAKRTQPLNCIQKCLYWEKKFTQRRSMFLNIFNKLISA